MIFISLYMFIGDYLLDIIIFMGFVCYLYGMILIFFIDFFCGHFYGHFIILLTTLILILTIIIIIINLNTPNIISISLFNSHYSFIHFLHFSQLTITHYQQQHLQNQHHVISNHLYS